MTNKDKNIDPLNLVQTRNLLDLELHELRPILYPKLLHLMETEKFDDDKKSSSSIEIREKPKSLQDFYINENLILKNRASIGRSLLLDDRCIVVYVHQKQSKLGERVLKRIRFRFYREILYSGKDYSKKLFNALLEHSLATGKTIIIDKNIRLERIGQNTQWKIDFTNYLIQNFKSSYEWLNHVRLSRLRQLGLLTLRNHLNQQMIKRRRVEINNRLQQEVQNHLDKEQQMKNQIKSKRSKFSDAQNLKNLQNLNNYLQNLKREDNLDEMDYSIFMNQQEESQLNLAEQKVQNVINELDCLQSFKYANQFFRTRGDLVQWQNRSSKTDNEHISVPKNYQQTNEFETLLKNQTKQFERDEISDILREERMRNQDDSEEDEMTATMPNYKQKKNKTKKWPKLRRIERCLKKSFTYAQLNLVRFLRRKTFNMLIRYEEIKKQHIFMEHLNASGQLELSAPLPANVPYCQIGKSSLIAALKQFNWSHTQGPFIYLYI